MEIVFPGKEVCDFRKADHPNTEHCMMALAYS